MSTINQLYDLYRAYVKAQYIALIAVLERYILCFLSHLLKNTFFCNHAKNPVFTRLSTVL